MKQPKALSYLTGVTMGLASLVSPNQLVAQGNTSSIPLYNHHKPKTREIYRGNWLRIFTDPNTNDNSLIFEVNYKSKDKTKRFPFKLRYEDEKIMIVSLKDAIKEVKSRYIDPTNILKSEVHGTVDNIIKPKAKEEEDTKKLKKISEYKTLLNNYEIRIKRSTERIKQQNKRITSLESKIRELRATTQPSETAPTTAPVGAFLK